MQIRVTAKAGRAAYEGPQRGQDPHYLAVGQGFGPTLSNPETGQGRCASHIRQDVGGGAARGMAAFLTAGQDGGWGFSGRVRSIQIPPTFPRV